MDTILSWNQAIEKGFEPRDYSYKKEDIPIGTHKATLDFKIWAKGTAGISCYFTISETNQKIILTVYRDRTTKEYTIKDVDFRDVNSNQQHTITVKLNSKGNIKFEDITA
jgi:hypothetical protein